MQLRHSFPVPAGVDEAWAVLTDIERVAACMPGAELDGVEGNRFTGVVTVKLGPIALKYKGEARWAERDHAARRAVIEAQGRDARGNGTAAATVVAVLAPDATASRVDVVTDLRISGRPAQFGRGVLADVGDKLIGQFAERLAAQLSGPPRADAPEAPDAPPEHIDLLATAGPAVARLAVPLAVAIALLVATIAAFRRRTG
jgi:carbon monoxide dehydrogenase subunit G